MCRGFIPFAAESFVRIFAFCFSAHLVMDVWVAPALWLLWIILLWIFVCKFCVWTYVFSSLRNMPRSGLAGSLVTLCITTFWRIVTFFSRDLYHCTCLPAMCYGLGFSTSSTTLTVVHLFGDSHPSSGEVFHGGFDLRFPSDRWCWASFQELIDTLYIYFLEKCVSDPLPIFKLNICLFIGEL